MDVAGQRVWPPLVERDFDQAADECAWWWSGVSLSTDTRVRRYGPCNIPVAHQNEMVDRSRASSSARETAPPLRLGPAVAPADASSMIGARKP